MKCPLSLSSILYIYIELKRIESIMVAQLTKNILKKKKKKKKLTKKNNNNGGRKTCHGQSSADFETLLFLTLMTDQSERAGRHSIVVGDFHRLFVHILSNAIMQSISIFFHRLITRCLPCYPKGYVTIWSRSCKYSPSLININNPNEWQYWSND